MKYAQPPSPRRARRSGGMQPRSSRTRRGNRKAAAPACRNALWADAALALAEEDLQPHSFLMFVRSFFSRAGMSAMVESGPWLRMSAMGGMRTFAPDAGRPLLAATGLAACWPRTQEAGVVTTGPFASCSANPALKQADVPERQRPGCQAYRRIGSVSSNLRAACSLSIFPSGSKGGWRASRACWSRWRSPTRRRASPGR